MFEEQLKNITQTVDGIPVKDLVYKPVDKVITGLVKDPDYGNPDLRDGYVSCVWNRHGTPLKLNKGREELKLKIN